MTFHRLNANPAGYDAFPAGYDFINNPAANGDPGVPANVDGKKASGPNQGTYYVAFGEDATSSDANRGFQALAQNTDWLDNALRKPIAMPTRTTDTTAVGAVSAIILPDASGVYLGTTGSDAIPETLLSLFSVLDSNDDEIIDPTTGTRCDVTAITGGTVGTGFSAGTITLTITPAIPAGTTYRVYYANKNNLLNMPVDALTVIKIRGAQELPAGFEDFQKQISRLTGTNVVALVATMIETPNGTRLAKSSAQSFEVDPDGTVGGIHRFFWRKARDTGGPVTMFEVNDDTSLGGVSAGRVRLFSGAVHEFVGTGLFRDANVAAGAAQGGAFIPWSSSTASFGDKYLRVAEAGPVGSAQTPTIFRALNSKWTVTVGDGTNSFGDFSGSDAIQQALAYIAAVNASATVHIKLKKGTYIINDANGIVDFASGSYATLEGVNPNDTVISTSSTAIPLQCNTLGFLRLKNLKIVRTAGNTTGFSNAGQTCLFAENCWFQNFAFLVLDPTPSGLSGTPTARNAIHMKECRFETNTLGVCPFTMQFSFNSSAFSGYVFEDCLWYVNDSAVPAVRIQAKAAMAANAVARGFHFLRSAFHLGSTGVTTGNPNGPCGPIDIKSNGTTYGSNGLRITDITFEECNVFAGSAKNSDATVQLLYLTPYDGSGTVQIDNFTVRGGKWLIMKNSPQLLPFWVGSAFSWIDGNVGRHPFHFTFNDVITGWANAGDYSGTGTTATGTYGVAPASYNSSIVVSVTSQPAYFISAYYSTTMKNVTFVGACGSSNQADLWIDNCYALDVDNVQLVIQSSTAAVKPDYRMKFSPQNIVQATPTPSSPKRKIQGLLVDGANLAALNTLATVDSAAVLVLPGGKLEVEGCEVDNFTSGVSTMAGMAMPLLDGAYTIDNTFTPGLKVRNCRFINNHNVGFGIQHGGTVSYAATLIPDLEISGCYFEANSQNGLYIWGAVGSGATTLALPGARIHHNYAKGSTGYQIAVFPSAFAANPLIVADNHVIHVAATDMLAIGTNKASGDNPKFMVHGNTCINTNNAGDLGLIGVRLVGGATFPTDDSSGTGLQLEIRGIEVGWTLNTGVIYRQYGAANGVIRMVQNYAGLYELP